MTAIVIIQYQDECDELKEDLKGLEIKHIILNDAISIQNIEGIRFTQVYLTSNVLRSGVDSELFDFVYGTLVHTRLRPNKGFRLIS